MYLHDYEDHELHNDCNCISNPNYYLDITNVESFESNTLKYFNGMIETGPGYVEKVNL